MTTWAGRACSGPQSSWSTSPSSSSSSEHLRLHTFLPTAIKSQTRSQWLLKGTLLVLVVVVIGLMSLMGRHSGWEIINYWPGFICGDCLWLSLCIKFSCILLSNFLSRLSECEGWREKNPVSVPPADCFTSVLSFILQLQDASLLCTSIFAIVLCVSTVCPAIFLLQTDRSEHKLYFNDNLGLN